MLHIGLGVAQYFLEADMLRMKCLKQILLCGVCATGIVFGVEEGEKDNSGDSTWKDVVAESRSVSPEIASLQFGRAGGIYWDIDKLVTALHEAVQLTNKAQFDDASCQNVLLFGRTGAGKSTLHNIMMGRNLIESRHERTKKKYLSLSSNEEGAIMGYDVISCTKLPYAKRRGSFCFYDLPGAFDTDGKKERLAASLMMEAAVKNLPALKLCIVIDKAEIDMGKGEGLKQLAHELSGIVDFTEQSPPSILYIINDKYSADFDEESIDAELSEHIDATSRRLTELHTQNQHTKITDYIPKFKARKGGYELILPPEVEEKQELLRFLVHMKKSPKYVTNFYYAQERIHIENNIKQLLSTRILTIPEKGFKFTNYNEERKEFSRDFYEFIRQANEILRGVDNYPSIIREEKRRVNNARNEVTRLEQSNASNLDQNQIDELVQKARQNDIDEITEVINALTKDIGDLSSNIEKVEKEIDELKKKGPEVVFSKKIRGRNDHWYYLWSYHVISCDLGHSILQTTAQECYSNEKGKTNVCLFHQASGQVKLEYYSKWAEESQLDVEITANYLDIPKNKALLEDKDIIWKKSMKEKADTLEKKSKEQEKLTAKIQSFDSERVIQRNIEEERQVLATLIAEKRAALSAYQEVLASHERQYDMNKRAVDHNLSLLQRIVTLIQDLKWDNDNVLLDEFNQRVRAYEQTHLKLEQKAQGVNLGSNSSSSNAEINSSILMQDDDAEKEKVTTDLD